jgi:hypothetical protein
VDSEEPRDPLECGLTFEQSDQVRLDRLLQREDRSRLYISKNAREKINWAE